MVTPRESSRAGRAIRRGTVFLTVAVYTVAAPFGCVAATALAFLWRRDRIGRARRMQRLTAGAYRLMHTWLRWTRLIDFDHRRPLEGVPDGPCVVVVNHPTLVDITALTATLGRGFTVVKPALYRRPLLRPFMVGAGHVAGAGTSPASLERVVDEAVERLRDGLTLLCFPEGTRSDAGRLHPFGRTAFEIACRAGVPVVSIAIDCEPLYLSKEVTVFQPPDRAAQLTLTVLAVDDPTVDQGDSRGLLRRVEERFRARLRPGADAGDGTVA